ncbi:MAG: hypothetical protein NZO58_02295, partial [Gemmataceae bacterium]|nr:hypothetical protein [Gemmataceae bacterium]
YRLGEPIKVTVRFPDNSPIAGVTDAKAGSKTDVKVVVEYRPPTKHDVPTEPEVSTIQLSKLEGSWGTFEYTLNRTREGKYRFRLFSPDVSKLQPDGEKPSAEATVELPPGELDQLRMNYQELEAAAAQTQGRFYTIVNANELLDDLQSAGRWSVSAAAALPAGGGEAEAPAFVGGHGELRPSLGSPLPAIKLWNQWWVFAIIMFLLTSEWVLRKRKSML